MKKLMCLSMVIMLFICSCIPAYAVESTTPPPTFSEEEIQQFRMLTDEASMLNYCTAENISAPLLSVHRTDTEYYITATYYPSSIIQYFLTNAPELSQKLQLIIEYDIKFDDSDWLITGQENVEIYGQFGEIFTNAVAYDGIPTNPITTKLLNLSDYNEELDLGAFEDCISIENGKAYIDLTKHTLEVMQRFIIRCGDYPYHTDFSLPAALREFDETTEIPPLPKPQIANLTAGVENRQITFRLLGDATVTGLQNANHQCHLEIRYKINDKKWSSYQKCVINPATFTIIDEPALATATPKSVEVKGDTVTVEARYYDATTDTYSDITVLSVPVHPVGDNHASIDMPGAHITTPNVTCGLCKRCSRPLNLCVWCLVGTIVCIAIAITSILIALLFKHKSPQKG